MDPTLPTQPPQTPNEPQPAQPQPQQYGQLQQPAPNFQAPAPQPQYAPSSPAAAPVAPRKSHKKRWIISIIVVIVVILLGLYALATYVTVLNRAKVNVVVTSFFSAAQAGDSLKVYNLMTDPTDESAKTFMNNAIAKVGKNCSTNLGGFTQSTTNGVTTGKVSATCAEGVKDWNFGLTYNAADRTWRIASLTFNGSSTSSTPSTPRTETVSAATCLTEKEANVFGYPSGISAYTGRGFITTPVAVFFQADSTAEVYPTVTAGEYDTFATNFKAYAAKEISVTLIPKVKESARSTAGDKLATQRAEYVKAELVKRGIPESRITIGASQNEGDSDASRHVMVQLTGSETCTL